MISSIKNLNTHTSSHIRRYLRYLRVIQHCPLLIYDITDDGIFQLFRICSFPVIHKEYIVKTPLQNIYNISIRLVYTVHKVNGGELKGFVKLT